LLPFALATIAQAENPYSCCVKKSATQQISPHKLLIRTEPGLLKFTSLLDFLDANITLRLTSPGLTEN